MRTGRAGQPLDLPPQDRPRRLGTPPSVPAARLRQDDPAGGSHGSRRKVCMSGHSTSLGKPVWSPVAASPSEGWMSGPVIR